MSERQADTQTSATEGTAITDTAGTATPPPEARQRLNVLAQQLGDIQLRRQAALVKVDTIQRAKRAAQGDATATRQQWSEKLRDSDGTLNRSIQKLRATERSALLLVEEYEAMEMEASRVLPHLELELARAADACLKARDEIIKEVAKDTIERVLASVGDDLTVAFRLFALAENAGVPDRMTTDDKELVSQFFGCIGAAIRHRQCDAHIADRVHLAIALPQMDLSAADTLLVRSPAARSAAATRLKAGAPEQGSAAKCAID